MAEKRPSVWQMRSDALRSVSLTSIAKQVSAEHLARRRERQGPEALLTPDIKANPIKMKGVLQAIFRRIGTQNSWVIAVDDLAVDLGYATAEEIAEAKRLGKRPQFNSIRRAIRDLKAASLIRVERRERARLKGGRGPNAYAIVWSNVVDLALAQGLQMSLEAQTLVTGDAGRPDEPSGRETSCETSPVTGGTGRPDEPSGRETSALFVDPGALTQDGVERSPSVGERSPSVGERSPSVGERAHPGTAEIGADRTERTIYRACAHADGPARHSSFLLQVSSDPPPPPSLSAPRPDRPPGRKEEEEDFDFDWEAALARLAAYGIQCARAAADAAKGGGWSARQVCELLDRCEARTIDGVQAWGGGAVYLHLQQQPPGSPITRPPCEAFRRRAAETVPGAQPRTSAEADALEAAHGAELDGLSTADLLALCPWPQLARSVRDHRARDPTWRPGGKNRETLLRELAARRQAAPVAADSTPEAGDH